MPPIPRRVFLRLLGGSLLAAAGVTAVELVSGAATHRRRPFRPLSPLRSGPAEPAPEDASPPMAPTPASFVLNLMSVIRNPMDYGARGHGADDTGPIQAALDACSDGGIFLAPPVVLCSRNLTIHGGTVLMGAGKNSRIRAITGTTGSFLSLSQPSATAVTMKDVTVDGNHQPGLTNIYYDNAGGVSGNEDALHRFLNVFSINAGLDAYHMGPGTVETNIVSCYAYNAGRYGYNFDVGATDSRVVACTSGLSASHGFFIQGNNNHFTDCKSYYSGFVSDQWLANVHGFTLYPAAEQDLHIISLTGCEAQNNSVDGFHIDGSARGAAVQHVTLTGCMADGNNEIGQDGVGLALNNVRNSTVQGVVTRLQVPAAQKYGLSLFGNLTGTILGGNDFNGSAGAIFLDESATGYKF